MTELEERARDWLRKDYMQDPDSDGDIYCAADMINAYVAEAEDNE